MGPEIAILDHGFACDSFDLGEFEMPLKEGKSKEAIQENIKTEIESGKDPKQAAAIAYHKAGESKDECDRSTKDGVKDMAEEKEGKEEKKVTTLDDVHAFMKDNLPLLGKIRDMLEEHAGKKEGETEIHDGETEEKAGEQKAADDAPAENTNDADEEKKKEEKAGMDALESRIAALEKDVTKTVTKALAQRDRFASEVASVVGTFDHSDKTVEEILAYGLEKAGISAPKGQEAGAWAGYMAGRQRSAVGLAFDSKKSTGGLIEKTLQDSQ